MSVPVTSAGRRGAAVQLRLLAVIVVVVAACGVPAGTDVNSMSTDDTAILEPPTDTRVETSESAEDSLDAKICQLPVMIRSAQAAAIVTIAQMEGPTEEKDTGRSYWTAYLDVEVIVDGSSTNIPDLPGVALPDLQPGKVVPVLVHTDFPGNTVDELNAQHEAGRSGMALLIGGVDVADPSRGVWFLRRFVDLSEGVRFLGGCNDVLNQDYQRLADALERKPDQQLLVDFASEVFDNERGAEEPGPIESAAFQLYEEN